MFTLMLIIAAFHMPAFSKTGTPSITHAPTRVTLRIVTKRRPSLAQIFMMRVAHQHRWTSAEIQAAWTILWLESRSTKRRLHISVVNAQSGCVGAAQFLSWQQYYTFGGWPQTALGQLKAFANYIQSKYGNNPLQALWFHEQHGYY